MTDATVHGLEENLNDFQSRFCKDLPKIEYFIPRYQR